MSRGAGVEAVAIPIRVLVVDDSDDDRLLLMDELRDYGFAPADLRVDTREAMAAALREQAWDIIIADYTMPRFSGPEALEVLHESGLDIPLILVSGTASEHTGVDMMRAGAQDFIVKHTLSRLGPAVARELGESESRRQRRWAEDAAEASAANYRMIFEHAPVAIVTYDRDAVIRQANRAFEELFGFSAEEVVGRHKWETFGLPENAEALRDQAARIFEGELVRNAEYRNVHKDGTPVYVIANITPLCDEQGEVVMALAMMTDITERRQAEAHRREFYRRTILAATDGKLVIAEPEEIERIAGPPVRSWEIACLESTAVAREGIREAARESGMAESRAHSFVACAVEAMANAHKHAGRGRVGLHRTPEGLMLVVSDKGPGIEALALPDVALTRGYTTATSLGMGYKLMIGFADRVYLATGPDGTVLAIEMAIEEQPPAVNVVLDRVSKW